MSNRTIRRLAAAVLLVLVAGCAAHEGAVSGTGRLPKESRHAATTAEWASWSVRLTAHEANGRCVPTAHLLVCSVASTGVVARSAATGRPVWRVATEAAKGGNVGLAVTGNIAVTAGGRSVRAVDVHTGQQVWSSRVSAGQRFVTVTAQDGLVYAITADAAGPVDLSARRASDGRVAWRHHTTGFQALAIGRRVYTNEWPEPLGEDPGSGSQAVARDARTGNVVAKSDLSHPCPSLVGVTGYLVCTGSRSSASDTFPPVTQLDPATLHVIRTLPQPGYKPWDSAISPAGVFLLCETSAEDPGGCGPLIAFDLRTGRTLWTTESEARSANQVLLVGNRTVLLASNDGSTRGRLLSIDVRTGPKATGDDRPRLSARYPEAMNARVPQLLAYGTHVIVRSNVRSAMRSVLAP